MKARWISATFVLAMVIAGGCRSCACSDPNREVDALPATAEEIFDLLFAHRKKAKIEAPLEAMPNDLDLVAASSDPEAWRSWAAEQPYVKRLMTTPLFRELRMSRAYLALDGLQHQAAQAASLTGSGNDRAALWKGPTAAGLRVSAEGSPSVVLVKSIDKSAGAVLRFAAAFAMISQKRDPESAKEVSGVDVRSLRFRDETIVFAVFENLLIAGNDAALVEQSVALAMKDGDHPASEDPLFPHDAIAGIHVRVRAPSGSAFSLLGWDGIGISLLPDQKTPVTVRRPAGEAGSPATALLRYAPETSFVALATDVSPKIDQSLDNPLVKEIASMLEPGSALILGVTTGAEASATPAGLLAFAHSTDPAKLEPKVRALLQAATGKPPKRSILESYDGTIVLDAGGPCVAIRKDALLLALDVDRIESALAAGSGKAPSLADKKGVDLEGGSGGVYLDLDRAASFLNAFYAHALENDGEAPWTQAQEVLSPTFAALGTGGVLFARMQPAGKSEEGALHVLP